MQGTGRKAKLGGIRGATAAALLALALVTASGPVSSPVEAQGSLAKLPAPPANGVMGFLIEDFIPPVIQEKNACPNGLAQQLKDTFLASQTPAERQRLLLKDNAGELDRLWKAYAIGPGGTNVCSHPDMFDRPTLRPVQSKLAWGLDLDQGDSSDTCAHDSFNTPTGERGIDNQEYRALGCTLNWRGIDGIAGDQEIGMRQHLSSGEWTQVLLLRGVDSLERDDDVEVVYANTPERPIVDTTGKFLHGASFTISNETPRERNVLKGRIVGGVLTTEPQDIKLVQTWGQSSQRDLRGPRSKWDYRKGRLRLTFQADGTLTGMLGGYRPVLDPIKAQVLGGAGSAIVGGFDCAAEFATLKKYADGIKDPATGKCTAISGAVRIRAIPAFVNDAPAVRTAARR